MWISGRRILDGRNNKRNSPKTGGHLACLRNKMKVSIIEIEDGGDMCMALEMVRELVAGTWAATKSWLMFLLLWKR